MKLHQPFFLLLCSILIFAAGCGNDDGGPPCVGCGEVPGPKDFTFTITGKLIEDCDNMAGVPRAIEFYQFDEDDKTFSLLSSVNETDAEGKFELSYTLRLNFPYNPSAAFSPPYFLKVPGDSVLFYLPGRTNLDDITLPLNDEINLDIWINASGTQLDQTEFIIYQFVPSIDVTELGFQIPSYRISGPQTSVTLLDSLTENWNLIEVSETGELHHTLYWSKIAAGGVVSSADNVATSTKTFCTPKKDRVDIVVN